MCMEFVRHADGVILGRRQMQLSHMIFFLLCVLSLCLPPLLFHYQWCDTQGNTVSLIKKTPGFIYPLLKMHKDT